MDASSLDWNIMVVTLDHVFNIMVASSLDHVCNIMVASSLYCGILDHVCN